MTEHMTPVEIRAAAGRVAFGLSVVVLSGDTSWWALLLGSFALAFGGVFGWSLPKRSPKIRVQNVTLGTDGVIDLVDDYQRL